MCIAVLYVVLSAVSHLTRSVPMCGLVGYWGEGRPEGVLVERMAQSIAHRGPDDAGVWLDEDAGLALAHRRLSIIDLSPAGHQPMTSPCGRYTLVFNGEIYNHSELRVDLQQEGGQFEWRGHSDTETLLAALRHWGIERALLRLNGMFAFALWDAAERRLYLARDRVGEKPLYYGGDATGSGAFLFGSELKALAAHPHWRGEVDRDALTLFLRHGYVPSPWSIYRGIRKLPPAHYVVVHDRGRAVSAPQCYWDLGKVAAQGAAGADGVQDRSDASWGDELDTLLRDAVKRRMAADVPLGAFLSGGFDSSTVVALMQAQSERPIKTFSIGFDQVGYDEANHAKTVAAHLGTEHTELYVTPEQAMAVIPELPTIWDEPFADASQIPTHLVSRLAREQVTVSLSGDGGDELFCGYSRYVLGYRLWHMSRRLPRVVRNGLAATLSRTPAHTLDRLMGWLPARLRVPHLADRLPKLASVLRYDSGEAFYRQLVSQWQVPAEVVLDGHEPDTLLTRSEGLPALADLQQSMMYLDAATYLPDDILTKLDRASMAVSLEARVPLLDHRLVEFAWRVPLGLKLRHGQGKWLLRQVLGRYVPPALTDRPKMGFAVPIDRWLRGPLRDWAEDLLDERRLRQDGYLRASVVRKTWHEHLAGRPGHQHALWAVLMFQSWLDATQGARKIAPGVASMPADA